MSKHELDANSFWQFSVTRYAAGETMRRCLQLQDKFGVNVNMLLLLCWCVENNRMLTLDQWQEISAAIQTSDNELQHHRTKRRQAKQKTPFNPARYQSLKAEELELERAQQSIMISLFSQQSHLTIEQNQVNGSIPAFIHLYRLRGHAEALALIAAIVK